MRHGGHVPPPSNVIKEKRERERKRMAVKKALSFLLNGIRFMRFIHLVGPVAPPPPP